MGKRQSSNDACYVGNGICTDIAIRSGIRKLPDANTVKHNAYKLTVCQEATECEALLGRRQTLSVDFFFVALADLDKLPVKAIGPMR